MPRSGETATEKDRMGIQAGHRSFSVGQDFFFMWHERFTTSPAYPIPCQTFRFGYQSKPIIP